MTKKNTWKRRDANNVKAQKKKGKKEESSCDVKDESPEDEKRKTKINKQKNSNYLPQKQFKVSQYIRKKSK